MSCIDALRLMFWSRRPHSNRSLPFEQQCHHVSIFIWYLRMMCVPDVCRTRFKTVFGITCRPEDHFYFANGRKAQCSGIKWHFLSPTWNNSRAHDSIQIYYLGFFKLVNSKLLSVKIGLVSFSNRWKIWTAHAYAYADVSLPKGWKVTRKKLTLHGNAKFALINWC